MKLARGLCAAGVRTASVAVAVATTIWVAVPLRAQDAARRVLSPLPEVSQAGTSDWPLHNHDPQNSRYSPLDQINVSNVKTLTVKWSIQSDQPLGQITPLVVNGVMYYHTGSKLVAANAATGEPIWSLQMEPGGFGARQNRGPTYGDGRIYAYGPSIMYAVDAQNGALVESFGHRGALRVINAALAFKYPGKHAATLDPRTLGYSMSTPPAYWNGTLYVPAPFSDSHIPGGLMVAVDATTGAIKWVFNTVPQSPSDEGWEIAKDTWGTGARSGGGVWTQPAIDPQLGMIYFNAGNPSPDLDGSARKGTNLFTDSTIALNLATGKLVWYYQAVHHDIWDWDLVGGPVLFDVTAAGRAIKGIAAAGKHCYVYFWDRATGKPLNPMVETPVSTKTDVPAEEVWPTQPIPYTSKGVPMQPFCATYPIIADPELAKRARPLFTPYLVSEFVTQAVGGANYGGPSFSPRTQLLYVSGKNSASSMTVKPVGNTMKPGPGNLGYYDNIATAGSTGITQSFTVTAYEPATGTQVWQSVVPGTTNAGNFVTGGDLIFQGVSSRGVAGDRPDTGAPGVGSFYAFHARSGEQLFAYSTKSGIIASPLTYQLNGKQYVTVVSANTILTFGLP